MPDRLERAKRYRLRAQELRSLAQASVENAEIEQLCKTASQYERMAEALERDARKGGVFRL